MRFNRLKKPYLSMGNIRKILDIKILSQIICVAAHIVGM